MPKKETLGRTRVVVTQDEGGCHAAMSEEWIQHGGPDGGERAGCLRKAFCLLQCQGRNLASFGSEIFWKIVHEYFFLKC